VVEDIEARTVEDILAEDNLVEDIPEVDSLAEDIPEEDILVVDKHLLDIPPVDNLEEEEHQREVDCTGSLFPLKKKCKLRREEGDHEP
jgi:hypothetical protein